ncbi:endo-1,4-beta-xylanase [Nocardiopsis trehalosi]|jgi:endo-1,4-beta-xylanase|uniref:endo-1,4-beta-xylanase n=1 Tax=Nocardiopsis trehalosi TaxID=109329 RepID=UPI000831808D|nr:endo-1,4-beta-xylanase [Nocardiopsis trehalosi]
MSETRRGRRLSRLPARALRGALAAVAAAALAVPLAAPAQADTPLRELADARDFEIGAALGAGYLSGDARFADLAATQFNAATAENAMKWDTVQPSRGQFNWRDADAFMDFAAANDQTVRGHTLVWHSQLPSWVSNGGFGAAELRGIMESHIDAVAGRYAGRVAYWDVVNEPFNDDGSWRNSVFYNTLGEGFVADALRMAAEADPNAELYLNDYNIEGINAKSNAYYELARDLLAQGVPLDGIGMQAHLINGQVPADLQRNIQRFADLGLDVAITELDVRIPMPADQNELQQQARDYRAVLDACLAVDRCIGVTVWGIVDRYSWVPDVFPGQGAPLIYFDDYTPKPSYYAIQEALGGPGGPGPGPDPEPGACEVDYTVQNQWSTGFTGQVAFTHNGASALSGWELSWSWPSGQRVSSGWSGTWAQSGSTVTVSNAAWNGAVPAGGTVTVGFNATHSGGNTAPTAFTLNGQACTAV